MFGDIRNQLGERLDYSFNLGSLSNRYLLVIPHSSDNLFKINLYSYLAEQVIQEGLSTLSFSFAGSGDSQGLIANSTLPKKISDLQDVLCIASKNSWRPIFVGHGLDSTIGMLASLLSKNLEFIVSLGGVMNTQSYAQKLMNNLHQDELGSESLHPNFIDSLLQAKNLLLDSKSISIPWLLIHGTRDKIVPVVELNPIIEAKIPERDLIEIDGGDHNFSGKYLRSACDILIKWIGKQMQMTKK